MNRRIPPLGLAVAAGVAQRLLARRRDPSQSMRVLAAITGTGSTVMLAAPVVAFRSAGTTVDPREQATTRTLVTGGANTISRNPMYLGMAGILLVHAISLRSARAVIPVIAFITWIDRKQIPGEEDHLHAQFGVTYETYQRRVPRWIGRPTEAN